MGGCHDVINSQTGRGCFQVCIELVVGEGPTTNRKIA